MKKLIFLCSLLIAGIANAQNKDFKAPDYKLIKSDIEDKKSNFYYKTLLEKFHSNDTLITDDEYKHLYYGTILQKDNDPYKRSSFDEELSKYYQIEELTEKDRKEFIELANKSLKELPIDLRLLDFLSYVYYLDDNKAMSKKTMHNFEGLFNAILSSGDGLTCETGFHVISISHEYMLLNIFELESISQSLTGNCDYLAFEQGKYKVDGLYFDITKMFEKNAEKFKK